jgi:hypothetical protein
MYKLYYDRLPGCRISSKQVTSIIKNKHWAWTKSSSIDVFLSFLGIDYSWTDNVNDRDALVIIEIDSAHTNVEAVFEYASKTYKKSIIVSTTEPALFNIEADRISRVYPNVMYLCAGDFTLNFTLGNVFLFPFVLIRPLTLLAQVKMHHLDMCNLLTSKKPYVFNHLSNMWAPNKYHMHYTIKKYVRNPSIGLTTYKPIDWLEDKSQDRLNLSLEILDNLRPWIAEINKRPIFADLYPLEDYINRADPSYWNHYKIEQLRGDTHFDTKTLAHPFTIYRDTHLSLITEGIKGRITFEEKPSLTYHYISEKTVQPILQGHLFVVNAPDRFHTEHLKDTFGFELYDELFDYADIEDTDVPRCANSSQYLTAYKIISQINEFDPACIADNAKVIAEKIHYNKQLLVNSSSKLRQNLRQEFVNILEHYRAMDT